MFRKSGRRVAGVLAATAVATAGLTACSSDGDGSPRVLATFTILADIADRVAGDVAGQNTRLQDLIDGAAAQRPGFTLRGGTNEVLRGVVARSLGLR